MACITKRSYSSWQVAAKDGTLKIKRTFLSKSEALDFAKQLEADGIAVAELIKNRDHGLVAGAGSQKRDGADAPDHQHLYAGVVLLSAP